MFGPQGAVPSLTLTISGAAQRRPPHACGSTAWLPELLGEPDEDSFGAPDVAEPIPLVLGHCADELRAAFAEPSERIVDVLHGKHDA